MKIDFEELYNYATVKYTKNQKIVGVNLQDHTCRLCLESKLFFEPPYYICNNCSQRIKKDTYYFALKDNSLHYCKNCFLRLSETITIASTSYLKSDFSQYKNEEVRKNNRIIDIRRTMGLLQLLQ